MEKSMSLRAAMKYLKRLEAEKANVLQEERTNSRYQLINGVCKDQPVYDFEETQKRLAEIDTVVCNIKHTMNVCNATSIVGDTGLTVDALLIKLAQMNARLRQMEVLASFAPKSQPRLVGGMDQEVVDCTNYDPAVVREQVSKLSEEIGMLHMAIDLHNLQTEIPCDILPTLPTQY